MKIETEILHERVSLTGTDPNVTPLFQNSSFLSTSEYFYSRKANPNCVELEAVLSKLEACQHTISVATGMAAINLVLRLLKPGDHILINNLVYGCSYRHLLEFAKHYNMNATVVDFCNADLFRKNLRKNTKLVFFETPTNPLLRTINIKQIVEEVRTVCPQGLVVIDNTWATPYFQKPLRMGADICVVSATKFYSGHNDCMGGIVSTNRTDLAETLRSLRFYSGCNLDPHSAWLLRRSMQTFPLRMKEHQRKVQLLASHLASKPEVEKVYLPEVDGHQMTGYGCILFFELKLHFEERVSDFMNKLKLFERGTSMACVVSAVAQPYTGSHLSLTDDEKKDMGIKKTLIRLCFGLEAEEDLIFDIDQALSCL